MANFILAHDAALTQQMTKIADPGGLPIDNNDLPLDKQIYLGAISTDWDLVARNNPGVDPIQVVPTQTIPEHAVSSAVTAGDEVRPTGGNGFIYEAQSSGNTAGVSPTWPTTTGQTVVDGDVTWRCVRRSIEPSSMKLALTQGGLDGAVAGATLDIGVRVSGGVANVSSFWVRIENVSAGVNSQALYPMILAAEEPV